MQSISLARDSQMGEFLKSSVACDHERVLSGEKPKANC